MNWKDFLTDVSKTVIHSGDMLEEFEDARNISWLGFSGSSSDNIKFHETRLSTTLPPSYKEFLKTSNGFKQLNCFIWDLLPIEKIQWLKDFDSSFHELWDSEHTTFNASNEDYFVYGDQQKTTDFRSEYLVKSLAISNWGDAAILLLNPEIKFGEEWEAWMFATWHLGPVRYKSFEELMNGEYSSFLDLLRNKA
jgi:hypothetical protein